ncbi:asparagine synthase (glutamine-hydrolyzing) [Psychrosphaera sp. B3R10]|uniref:asparagine synthase (glutamine-hydrolyzing) n=1 Tax=unclassified Psychrosphaera TaxID=2641570 RepID=UPI001C09803C|nr:asparagine synthase (glutamine-hydrolyzing) [Psychrosphaera sp. 1_MG-2023]MBU2881839.1 asparagine synthase (glutamine-hydrolyzing) [Psychrosphaera sp. I2R16]MBU2989189.1 asparagine synthase (glutamine-hydrolyzing) [Psychrosphaera sp. B3R10]MDO6719995.1 asparagine synthase (glutamine-hydrolyzing) [Psychrosphaera sp. 1_MG-2023]
MCGIIGQLGGDFNEGRLDSIKHRGPNNSSLETVDFGNELKLHLGHTRLSIQDLSDAGSQPMYSKCGQYLIVFNGEIYNHLELRKELDGISWSGHSDTETIVNYLALKGIDSIIDFNGIFSFCFVDLKNRSLFLVRDRFGVKPLYYIKNDSSFSFSSELRGLDFEKNLDVDKLATTMFFRYSPAPSTIYDGVSKLLPGHILKLSIEKNTCALVPMNYLRPAKRRISFSGAVSEYGLLFEQAIQRQMLSDVEVGVLLSGGIDSALVAFYAQKYSKGKLKTFTVGFHEEDDSNELKEAAETARILGTEHFEILVSKTEFQDSLRHCVQIVEEPLATTSLIPMYFLNKLASKYVNVVLTGQGADEPLGGYRRYLGEKYAAILPSFLGKPLSSFASSLNNRNVAKLISSLANHDRTSRFNELYSLFSKEEIGKLLSIESVEVDNVTEYFVDLLDKLGYSDVENMMSNDCRRNLSDDLLNYTDKISMNFSVEARVPLLDNDLVDYIESLPLKFKIRGYQGKYIHKKFAETVLPNEIVYRKKKGFKSPTEKWFKDKGEASFKEILLNSSSFCSVFDKEYVHYLFEEHQLGKKNLEKQLFFLVSVFYLLEEACK